MQKEKEGNLVLSQREQLVLSSILFDKDCRDWAVYNGINEDLFEDKSVKRMVKAFVAVSEYGDVPTDSLLLDQLAGKDEKNREHWFKFLNMLKQEVPPENKDALEKHVAILKDSYVMRKYGVIARRVLNYADTYDPFKMDDEKHKIKNFIESAFFELDEENVEEVKQMDMSEGIQYTIQNMKESLTNDNSETVPTGYLDLDNALDGGFKKGTFTIIAARPGMGKTVWMLNSAVESAKVGSKVLFVSIEMTLLQCFQRLIAKLANISGKKIQRPEFITPKEWDKLYVSAKEIIKLFDDKFWIHEITEITIPQLERIIKHYKKKHAVDAVYVDYAQIMLTKDGNEPKEASDFAQISGGLRRAAKNHNVAIIVGSQLNREVEKRNDKKPIMADIRNSGAFEQDAAYIFGLYRDEQYNEDSEKPNVLEFIFLKNRFGKNGITIDFNYDLEKQSILSQADPEAS